MGYTSGNVITRNRKALLVNVINRAHADFRPELRQVGKKLMKLRSPSLIFFQFFTKQGVFYKCVA